MSTIQEHRLYSDATLSASEKNNPAPPPRNVAVDAYRGLVMMLMMGEVMRFADVARSFPQSTFWRILAYNQTHVEWSGMSLHDTIQPGFTFLAGVALPGLRGAHALGDPRRLARHRHPVLRDDAAHQRRCRIADQPADQQPADHAQLRGLPRTDAQ